MPALLVRFLAILSLATLAPGCALQPRTATTPLVAVGEIDLTRNAGRLGLTVVRDDAGFNFATPENRTQGATSLARESALETLRSGGEAAIVFPASFILGGLAGAVFGVSESTSATGADALRRAVDEAQFHERLATALAASLAAHGTEVGRVADNQPLSAPAALRHVVSDGRRVARLAVGERATHPLHGRGTDTLLAVRVIFQGFQRAQRPSGLVVFPRDELNPPLALLLAVNITALRVADWQELGGVSIHSTTEPRAFTDWAAGDAAAFRRELEHGTREIIREIEARIAASPAVAASD